MEEVKYVEYGGKRAQVYTCGTVIVGTGAAGYNAADRLWSLGHRNIIIVSENKNAGTSRNTGSDKQTYYKLTLSGSMPDSVGAMAQTLFEGQCVDGDIALCEAALSVPCFMKLAELGLPFPRNRYGEYVGYKTDHDPAQRATSIGPYTSKQMTYALEKSVQDKGIALLDRTQVIKILSDGSCVYGLLCYQPKDDKYILVRAGNIVYATGGPAGMYRDSVYPQSQFGATGLALEAGALGKNLTEWQYGLASVNPRWNVSGSYMQVLPRMYSCEKDGSDEREFLADFFETPEKMLSMLFLKGYQWPFDVRKAINGSSVIDILVYMETSKGRRIFLDYTKNPLNADIPYEKLTDEARTYLEKAEACFGTPYERLKHINSPAIDFYMDRNIDLSSQPLEIALCVQHNNGGLGIDNHWQTCVKGLFAVGEAAGSHGVYRPGGSALNAGQVGSMRAAEYISAYENLPPEEEFEHVASEALKEMADFAEAIKAEKGNVKSVLDELQGKMSLYASAFREYKSISEYYGCISEIKAQDILKASNPSELSQAYRVRDMLICQRAYLFAMLDYIEHGGKSRGSALYTDKDGQRVSEKLPDTFTLKLAGDELGDKIQEIEISDGKLHSTWRDVRPVPENNDVFETVWRGYRENKNII